MVVDENNKFITARQNNRLLLIKVVVHTNSITLTYKDNQPITVHQPQNLNEAVVCE